MEFIGFFIAVLSKAVQCGIMIKTEGYWFCFLRAGKNQSYHIYFWQNLCYNKKAEWYFARFCSLLYVEKEE